MKNIYSKIFLGSLALAFILFAYGNVYSAERTSGTSGTSLERTSGTLGGMTAVPASAVKICVKCPEPTVGTICGMKINDNCGSTLYCPCGGEPDIAILNYDSFTGLKCSDADSGHCVGR